MEDETLIWGKFHKWRQVKTRVLLNLSEAIRVGSLLEACDLTLAKLFIEYLLDPENLGASWQVSPEFAQAAVLDGEDTFRAIRQDISYLPEEWQEEETFLRLHFGIQKETSFPVEEAIESGSKKRTLLANEVLILHRMLTELLKEAEADFREKESPQIDRFARDTLQEVQKTAKRAEEPGAENHCNARQVGEPGSGTITTRIYLLDPRLPHEDAQRLRQDLHGKTIYRDTPYSINGGYRTSSAWTGMHEGKEVRLLVYDESELLEHFVPEKERDQVKGKWAKIRREVLRQYLKDNPFTRAIWTSFDKSAVLAWVEDALQQAETDFAKEKYSSVFSSVRKVTETIFRLIIGEDESYRVNKDAIKDNESIIKEEYSWEIYHDILNLWTGASYEIHRPALLPSPSKGRDLLGRAQHLWEMFKFKNFGVYGIEVLH